MEVRYGKGSGNGSAPQRKLFDTEGFEGAERRLTPSADYAQSVRAATPNTIQYVHMQNRGFTLIELLVVIAIIGLLASIVIASLTSVQAKARDTHRMEDINQLERALALYAADYSHYPIETSSTPIAPSSIAGAALLSSGAMSTLPSDPTTFQYSYISDASGGTYTINFCLETDTIRGYAAGCSNNVSP